MKLNIKSKWYIFRKDSDERNQFFIMDNKNKNGIPFLKIFFSDTKEKEDSLEEFLDRTKFNYLNFTYSTYLYQRRKNTNKMKNYIGVEENLIMMQQQIKIMEKRIENYQLFLDFKNNHQLKYQNQEIELKEFIKFNKRLNSEDNYEIKINIFDNFDKIFKMSLIENPEFNNYLKILNQWTLLISQYGKNIGFFSILLEDVFS